MRNRHSLWMLRTIFLLLASILLHTSLATAAIPRAKSYVLDVTFQPDAGALDGRADIRLVNPAAAPDTLDFYLHGELWFTSASCGGSELDGDQELVFYPMDYSSVARRIRLVVGGADLSAGLILKWKGPMNPSMARARSNYMRIDADGVFLRSYGYSLWFPLLLASGAESYPVDFESVTLRTPAAYVPVFTGIREHERVEGATRVSRWKSPATDLFAAQCVARPYREVVDGDVHLYHLEDPAATQNAERVLHFIRELRAFYNEHYRHGATEGALHVAQLCDFGNISSGNMIGLSDDAWLDFEEGSYSGQTLAHELVHAYIAVPTPESDPTYALVREGFPTYFHLPALAQILGEPWYDSFMNDLEAGYQRSRSTGRDRRGRTLPVAKPVLEMTAADIGTYKDFYIFPDRLRLYFDQLRRRLGPEKFLDLADDLFNQDAMSPAILRGVILRHAPEFAGLHDLWLGTDQYRPEMQRPTRK